jgi:hypothetical protein
MGLFGNLFGKKDKQSDLEDEFYNLMQQQALDLMGQGVSLAEVPQIATNQAAELMMRKYALPMDSMVKIIERSMKRHR